MLLNFTSCASWSPDWGMRDRTSQQSLPASHRWCVTVPRAQGAGWSWWHPEGGQAGGTRLSSHTGASQPGQEQWSIHCPYILTPERSPSHLQISYFCHTHIWLCLQKESGLQTIRPLSDVFCKYVNTRITTLLSQGLVLLVLTLGWVAFKYLNV